MRVRSKEHLREELSQFSDNPRGEQAKGQTRVQAQPQAREQAHTPPYAGASADTVTNTDAAQVPALMRS